MRGPDFHHGFAARIDIAARFAEGELRLVAKSFD
jgi:hypothetical protein